MAGLNQPTPVAQAVGSYPSLADRRVILSIMLPTNLVLLFKLFTVLAVAVFVLVFWRPSNGGRPPRPMHPSPADDTVLLWKRRKKKVDSLFRG